MERRLGLARDLCAHLLRRADGDRALCDDELGRVHVLADRRRDGEDMLQIGRAVFVGRRPDGDEHHLGALDRVSHVGRECQPALALVAHHDRLETRLVDRELVGLEVTDLAGIDVGANDVVPRLGETGPYDQTDIAGADDGDLHARVPALGKTCRVSTVARECRATSL